ncbi:hypothetical protein Mal15_30260 [Stieleria maiorica]|uniref:Glutaredoxin n=1 Tax=Stieleria maiorica TaxID=2795974 RepID=A0A5B9MD23_9BACT|nr:hypothetical protein [Stieleria maiorica]QEF98968.1 hypothetical protein Mal15_30260 [Stieleria maiorica]
MLLRLLLLSILVWWTGSSTIVRAEELRGSEAVGVIRMDVFVRSDRDSAEAVSAYCGELKQRTNGLEVRIHDVLKDKTQLLRLYQLSKKSGRPTPVLPAIYVCDRMFFGFDDAVRTGPEVEKLFTANLYTRTTCPKCQNLKAFLPTLKKRWPAIRFVIHDVDQSATARSSWEALCRKAGSPPGLPTIDFAGRILIGYQGDDVTGAQLGQLIRDVSGVTPDEPLGWNRSGNAGDRLVRNADRTLKVQTALLSTAVLPTRLLAAQPPPTEDSSQLGAAPSDTPSDSQPEISLDMLELPDEATAAETGASEVPPEVVTTDTIDVPMLGRLSASELGMPLFTLAVGLVDGFNPCAMWVLVFLLSVLVNIKDRRKILVIAGTFVFVSGLAYYAFMAAWLSLFLLIGIARPVQIALGLLALFIGMVNVKDFFALKKGISLSIPESHKPGLYRRVREIVGAKYLSVALAGAVVLAVIVNMIELLCTAGLPALYTQVLAMQEYPSWKNYSYLLLYIAAYMFDDALLVTVVVATLSHRRLQEREGRWLKLLSGAVILVLGLVMLLRPSWLQLGS